MNGPYLSQTQQQRMQQTLAPQLRQSLELLQVPVLELRTLIREEMEQNPTLEEAGDTTTSLEAEAEKQANDTESFDDEFKVLAELDDEWREYFFQDQARRPYSAEDAARRQFFLDSIPQIESLQQHLLDQLSLADLGEEKQRIGELIIGSINDDGYLTSSLEELAFTTGYSPSQIEPILELIKDFDPIGIGSRDLCECLLIQLERLGKADSLSARLVRDHLPALGARKFNDLARLLKLPLEDIEQAAKFIGTLEPKPGRRFSSDATRYVLPEVIIQKLEDDYIVIINNDQIPHLHISEHYRQLMKDPGSGAEVKTYIRDKVRAGMFLIKSINQRQQTIFNIATEIVHAQRDFLDHGVTQLRPLTMAQVADVVGIHETTVSRAINGKYMQTPRGTFEMKYFFTPGYKTADGQSISNQVIKDAIQHIVEAEDADAPLSDQAIVAALAEKGFKVARRTVAKYREELKILPSHLRKGF
ncbi:MAG TPA: RNA polymerase factor sigma-54 [Kiritimatiellia bacterium]|nr:RNA polymerase factor sigma-54 [Kiritimatiellia bacterium]